MDLVTECPNCGKQLSYNTQNAGRATLCPACGARPTLPSLPTAPLLSSADDEPPSLPAPPRPDQMTPPFAQANVIVENKATNNYLVPIVIAVAAVAFIQAMILLWIGLRPHPTWEQMHRQEVLDLKAEAESLAARGQTQQAYDSFRDLQRLVTGNAITDPALLDALQTAQEEQASAASRLLQLAQESAAPPPPPPPLPPAQTQPAAPAAPVVAQVVHPARPPVHPLPAPDSGKSPAGYPLVDDARIGITIENGVTNLLNQFEQSPDGAMRIRNNTGYPNDGVDALTIYALLQAYAATGDSRLDPHRDFMKQALDTLDQLPFDDKFATYSHSLRANALELAGRREDARTLETDLHWLLRAGITGAYTYVQRPPSPTNTPDDYIWDNSNSQYGLLGVWACAEAGLSVPAFYWKATEAHWLSTQLDDGRWGYAAEDTDGTRSMTLAGLASLLVSEDYLYQSDIDNSVAHDPYNPAITRAMAWLETGDNSAILFDEGFHAGYALYGLERVGLASGYKYFGAHDWYRESAANVVNAAHSDGAWGDQCDTSFALLFLARGRHPVFMNKLQFDGYWSNRPRDIANLTRYASHTLEHALNWQVVPISHDWTDWTDSPILYIASHAPPNISSDDEAKLRQYVLSGGMLVTQADGGSKSFDLWAQDLGRRLFPQYHWADLPADHSLWTVGLHVKNRPRVLEISNGARLLMVELPEDLSSLWQSRDDRDNPDAFAFGLDLFLYASGRSELQNRLISTAIPETADPPQASIKMAQIQLPGATDPEPAAWPRFARWFRRQTDLGVEIVPTSLDDLSADSPPIAHLTGIAAFKATDLQCDALREYVNNGGVLLIDPCGGPNEFLRSVRDDLLPRAFSGDDLVRLDGESLLLSDSADGMSQLWPPEIRDIVREEPSPIDRGIYVIRSGKGAVVLSSLDITSGLLGSNTWGIAGFTPNYSLELAKNFVLWAWDGAKTE
ncbi:MAG TPA: DUF4159 domain-containing protein [Tepidisphaeraceae bacterium]|nr:DUF4159 domain-containing protein [Tepidisphaeraceae bacterium]